MSDLEYYKELLKKSQEDYEYFASKYVPLIIKENKTDKEMLWYEHNIKHLEHAIETFKEYIEVLERK